jgi:tol-pal system protein YbgF
MQAAQSNLPANGAAVSPGTQPGPAAQQPSQQQAPPPDVLYNNALRDYNAAKYELAAQEFGDYLKFYPNTDLAGNAQFYLADLEYRQNDFESAVRDYDKVLEQYPGGNKAPAAQLKKGMALEKLNRRADALKEFQSLVQRYPRSIEADQARAQLRALGSASSLRPSGATTRRKPQ